MKNANKKKTLIRLIEIHNRVKYMFYLILANIRHKTYYFQRIY